MKIIELFLNRKCPCLLFSHEVLSKDQVPKCSNFSPSHSDGQFLMKFISRKNNKSYLYTSSKFSINFLSLYFQTGQKRFRNFFEIDLRTNSLNSLHTSISSLYVVIIYICFLNITVTS